MADDINGTTGSDDLPGTSEGEVIRGGDGDDNLRGEGGNDELYGEGDHDWLAGGEGDDIIDGGAGRDTVNYLAAAGSVTVDLSSGTAGGADGNDTLTGIEDVLGSHFSDIIIGDDNANFVEGFEGEDEIYGNDGADTLSGGDGDDFIYGGDGQDRLIGGLGDDYMIGGDGEDTADYSSSFGGVVVDLDDGSVAGAAGSDTLINIENVIGTEGGLGDILFGSDAGNRLEGLSGNDELRGFDGEDTLIGGDGADFINGGTGDDIIEGGEGRDRAAYYTGNAALGGTTVDLNLQGQWQDTGGQGSDFLAGIENVSGTPFADTLTGDGNDNWLWGSPGQFSPGNVSSANNDTLDGAGGNDLLTVGIGNHILIGGSGTDTVRFTENSFGDPNVTISLESQGVAQDVGAGTWTLTGIENLSGGTGNDTLTGDGNANVLAGDAGDDLLIGGGGNDILIGDGIINVDGDGVITTTNDGGGNGNDTFDGGLGNDTLNGGLGMDTATYANAAGNVTVNLNNGTSSGADGNDTLVNIENVTGSGFNDSLTGNAGANLIQGLAGNDTLQGHSGDDTIYGGDGNDMINGDLNELDLSVSGNDTIDGGNGDDFIRAGLGDDLLLGGAGNDIMRGGGGVDSYDGGADIGEQPNSNGDRVSFSEQYATQGAVADLRTGLISNDGFGNVETMIGVESLGGDTAFVDTLHGNDGVNGLIGNKGDYLYGYGGNDTLSTGSAAAVVDGGAGTDRLVLSTFGGWLLPDANGDGRAELAPGALTGWTVNLGAGTTLDGYGNSGSITGIENVVGSFLGDSLIGDPNANILSGAEGDDTLEGGLGNDTLEGDSGTDTATYANASGGVFVNLFNGTATGADGSDTLVGIENVTGSGFNDSLDGDDSANVLGGLGGNDSLRGHGGNDTLSGGSGSDLLTGGTGDDVMDGGDGRDRIGYYTTNAALGGATVNLALQGQWQDTGGQGSDFITNVENVSGTPFADTLTGDEGDNWLWGSPGQFSPGNVSSANNDTLDGAGGNDLLTVGIGNHTLIGGSGTDTVRFTENGSPETSITVSLAGQGAAQATGNGSWTLTGIENLSGGLAGDTLTGDGAANTLAGDAGNDLLIGGGGNDTLLGDGRINVDANNVITTTADNGGNGNDTLEGGLGNDVLNGGGGTDTATYANAAGGVTANLFAGSSGADGNDTYVSIENLIGSAHNDTLVGNNSANTIDGGGGIDTILGFGGNDTLNGGEGSDQLFAMQGDDIVNGGAGSDNLIGGSGNDLIDGGSGYNVASFAQVQNDIVTGGVTVDLRLQGVAQNTGQGSDTLVNIHGLSGTQFNDTLNGDDTANWLIAVGSGTNGPGGDDQVYGNGGDDLISLGTGNTLADGGSGSDTVAFAGAGTTFTHGVTISLAIQNAAQATSFGNITLVGIENLSGSTDDDVLIGDGSANILAGAGDSDVLAGGGGNDRLYGDGIYTSAISDTDFGPPTLLLDSTILSGHVAGNDTLEGGLGDDQLYGGAGSDTATWANAAGAIQAYLYNNGFGEAIGAEGYDQLFDMENLTGSAFDDTLVGNNGANVLDAGAGKDYLSGGAGNDTLLGGSSDDLLSGGTGNDTIDGGAGFDRASFYNANPALGGVTVDLNVQGSAQDTGAMGVDTLIGIEHVNATVFADTLTGDGNDNWLWGAAAYSNGTLLSTTNNDTIDGGGGNDLIVAGLGNHLLEGGSGTDTVGFSESTMLTTGFTMSLALQGQSQNTGWGNWTVSGFENVAGNAGHDTLTGDGNANVLAGNMGDDILSGGGGNDTLLGDGEIAADTNPLGLSGPIVTRTDAAVFYGAVGGNDTLEGGLGNDILNGGLGIDTATYANAGGGVTVNLGSGTSSGADGNDTLLNIENATGSAYADTLLGSSGNNVLSGGAGRDTIRGNAGDDTILGGAGNDFIRGGSGVDSFDGGADDGESDNELGDRISFFETGATQGVVADLRSGVIANDGFGNVEAMVGIESLGGDTAYADTFYGNDGRNGLIGNLGDYLYGFGGDDWLQMSAAAAMVDGGDGFDRLLLDAGGGWLSPDANGDGQGESAAAATVGWTVNLAAGTTLDGYGNIGSIANIERLDGSILGDTLTGDGNANTLNGAGGNDIIEGGDGNDTLDGGADIDTASYAGAGGGVTVDLFAGTATGAAGSDTLAGFENATGSGFADVMWGDGSANLLSGLGGNDTIRGEGGDDAINGGDGADFISGGAGVDAIDGGLGRDRVSYYQTAAALGGVIVSLVNGTATGAQGSDTLTGIENVSGTPFADSLTGDDGDNWLWGAAATIGAGNVSATNNDTMNGGNGNDLLTVGIGNHTLVGGAGTDTVSFTENGGTEAGLSLSLATAQGAGQKSGAGTWALSAIENLSGGTGNDKFTGSDGDNVLAGNLGADVLTGGLGNDILLGDGFIAVNADGVITTVYDAVGGGNDTLNGGRGNDILYGGTGNDILAGGADFDQYVIGAGSGNDRIIDFADGIDKIIFDPSSGVDAFLDLVIAKSGANVLISWGTTDSILVEGLKTTQFTAADFGFGAPTPNSASAPALAALADFGGGGGASSGFGGNDMFQHGMEQLGGTSIA